MTEVPVCESLRCVFFFLFFFLFSFLCDSWLSNGSSCFLEVVASSAGEKGGAFTFTFYIYAFSRRFYPKRLTLHSSYSFYILSGLAFPGNRTHDLGVASAMLYQLSYRKAAYGSQDSHQVVSAQRKKETKTKENNGT